MVEYGAHSQQDSRHPLDCFFSPRAVAVIGASERTASVGRTLLWNLISNPFGGTVYAVNPHHQRVLGIRTLKSIQEAPEPIDLALIMTPAATVPAMLDACIRAGVPGAVIISADFSLEGAPSHALSEDIRARCQEGRIRVIGPNSLGLMNPAIGLNAAYASTIALKGSVGFISQSGALCASILDWSLQVRMGFSAFVSLGQMVDVGWSELIYYLGSDPNTKSIVLYMEYLGNARAFLSAAREVALSKPIIVLKTGKNRAGPFGEPGTSYFSATDTTDDELLSAALARSGVLRVPSMDILFSMAEALGKQPRPKGPRLTIISNAAGPAVLATDALVGDGGKLAKLSPETSVRMNEVLPPHWNHTNPIDILPDADPTRYKETVKQVIQDENSDGVLILLAPQVATAPTATAEAIVSLGHFGQKPVLASWMGGALVEQGTEILNEHCIPTFPYPDQAARIFASMWRYSYAVKGLYETPEPQYGEEMYSEQRRAVTKLIDSLRSSGITRLNDVQSKLVLSAYGIPTARTILVYSEAEALAASANLDYPVAWTVIDPHFPAEAADLQRLLAHPTHVRAFFRALSKAGYDVAGQGVSLYSDRGSAAYLLRLSGHVDEQFGPYILFGLGGSGADVVQDHTYALPPLNTTLARRAMERTRFLGSLHDRYEQTPLPGQIEQILIRFSHLLLNERWIRSLEVHPLAINGNAVSALEASATLYDLNVRPESLPQPAIRPYPVEYCKTCRLSSGSQIILRPIRPEDETLMVKFHETLSSETVYFHYMRLLSLDQRIRHDHMSQMCFIDYDRQIGLVAERTDANTGERSILAIARLVRINGTDAGDFAIAVNDRFQHQGLGKLLLAHLLDVAKAEQISPVLGIIHPENSPMLNLCRKLGFQLHKPIGEEVRAEYRAF